jgi:hypothetical protein
LEKRHKESLKNGVQRYESMISLLITLIQLGTLVGFFVGLFRGCMGIVHYISYFKYKEEMSPEIYNKTKRKYLINSLQALAVSIMSLIILFSINWSGVNQYL